MTTAGEEGKKPECGCGGSSSVNKSTSVSTYPICNFLMPRSELHPTVSLKPNDSGDAKAPHQTAFPFWFQSQIPESNQMSQFSHPTLVGKSLGTKNLTLSAGRSFPALFADARKRIAAHDTSAPVVAGVRQAAAVPGCKTERKVLLLNVQKCAAKWATSGDHRHLPMLQVAPSHPAGHMHLKVSPSSQHVPPLLHVASSHWLSPADGPNKD